MATIYSFGPFQLDDESESYHRISRKVWTTIRLRGVPVTGGDGDTRTNYCE
jgi:hypothetical protein